MPVIIDPVTWAQLEQVQALVNNHVRYQSDQAHYGKADYWEVADTRGDCEDYALAKRERLMALGWPPEALRIATVINERGEMHAVLTVDVQTAKGQEGTYVLDNRMAMVEPWQRMTQIGYRWIARSKPGQAAWTFIGAPVTMRFAVAAAIAPVSPAMMANPAIPAVAAAAAAAPLGAQALAAEQTLDGPTVEPGGALTDAAPIAAPRESADAQHG